MKTSYLVQRLKKPYGSGKNNPFAFGGGLLNGGLSSEAMDLIGNVFSFDYMGAAEFEFGAVPEALQNVATNADRCKAFSFTLPLKKVAKGWRDKSTEDPTGDIDIYVICREEDVTEVQTRIKGWAVKPYDKKNQLKETTLLSQTLRPDNDWKTEVQGWLELDNGFFFFTNKVMWEKTADLFGIEAE